MRGTQHQLIEAQFAPWPRLRWVLDPALPDPAVEVGMHITIYSAPGMHGEQLKFSAIEALKSVGLKAAVNVETDEFNFARAGVLFTPAVAVDGRLISNGWMPKPDELLNALAASSYRY
jgi:hypothetical protein